jgi:hypothetical protein
MVTGTRLTSSTQAFTERHDGVVKGRPCRLGGQRGGLRDRRDDRRAHAGALVRPVDGRPGAERGHAGRRAHHRGRRTAVGYVVLAITAFALARHHPENTDSNAKVTNITSG